MYICPNNFVEVSNAADRFRFEGYYNCKARAAARASQRHNANAHTRAEINRDNINEGRVRSCDVTSRQVGLPSTCEWLFRCGCLDR